MTERGICWSTSQNPTVADAHTYDGMGTGAFTSNITGLEPNTTYYVRAYATNSEGTAYGEELTFTTPCYAESFVSVTATETDICVGGSVTIEATTNDMNVNVSYSWSVSDNYSSAAYTFIPDHAGSFDFTVTATDLLTGCTSSDTIAINVNDIPATPVLTADNATIYDGGQVTLTVTNPVAGAVYTWYKNGVLVDGATQAVFIDAPTTVGGEATSCVYNVMVALANSGCVSEISEPAVVTVNVPAIPGPLFEFREINGTESIRSMEANQGEQSKFEMYLYDNSTSPAEPDDKVFIDFQIYKDGVPMSNAELAEAMDDYVGSYKMLYDFDLSVGAAALSNMTMQSATNAANGFFPNNEIFSGAMPYHYDWFYMHFLLGPENQDNGRKITINTGTWKPGSSGVYTFSYAVVKAGDFTSNNSIRYDSTKRVGGYSSHVGLTVKDTIVADFFTVYVGDNTGGGPDTPDTCLTLPTATVDGPDYICHGDANNVVSVNITDPDVYFRNWSYLGPASDGLINKYSESLSLNGFPLGTHIFGANIFDTVTHCTNTVYDTIRVVGLNAELMVEPSGAVCENDTVKVYCRYYQQDETDSLEDYMWYGSTVEYVSPGVRDTVWMVPTLNSRRISLIVYDSHGCSGTIFRDIDVVACATLPTVTTGTVSDITETTATCVGEVSADGGAEVTECGVCWGTSANPTVDGSHVEAGTGTGTFTASITGLTPNTTYYVRAYATNSEGTAYGEEVTFATPCYAGSFVSVTATETDICVGGSVTVEATTNNINGNVLYNWSVANYYDGPVCTFMPDHAGVFNVVVTATDLLTGCTSSDTIAINVNDIPATPVVTADNATVYDGGQVTLTVTNPVAGAVYTWYRNGNLVEDATQATLSDAPTTVDGEATSYVYNVMVALANSGCVSEISDNTEVVTVFPLPIATVTVEGNTVLCDGGSITLHVDVAPYNDPTYLYQWYEDGMLIPGATTPDYVVTRTVRDYAYNFTVMVSAMNGGFNITANAPAITVTTNPIVTIDGNPNVCETDFVSLTANIESVSTFVDNIHFTWYESGQIRDNMAFGLGDSDTYMEYLYPRSEPYTFTVEVTNGDGCTAISEPFHVNVHTQPVVILTASETNICVGGTTTVYADAIGEGNISYSWSVDNVSGSNYTFMPDHAGTFNIAVTATSELSGCTTVDSVTINVNDVLETPVVTTNNATIFEGGQVTLTVANPVHGATYTWYRNGMLIAGATQSTFADSPMIIDGETAHYTYTVVAVLPNSGCVSNISSSTMVTVNPLPVATVTFEGNTLLCEGRSVTLHADVAPYNDPTYLYQWYEDGVLIPGATSADYVVTRTARDNAYNFMVMVSGMSGSFNITANAPAITVVPSPTVVASISESTICVGGTATLTAMVEGGVAGVNGYNFQWYGIAGTSTPRSEVVGTGSSYTTSGDEPAGNYPYWVMVSDEYGCSSQSGMVILAVVSQPAVTITRTVGYGEMVCEGGSTAIQANVTGGYGERSYQWYANGYILPDETNQSLAINNLAFGVNDTYTVVVAQTGAGCSNSVSADINTLVSVYHSYTVAVSGPNEICEGGDLTMFAEVNNVIPGNVLSYQWHEIMSGQDILIEGANSIMYTAADLQSGSLYEYYVVVNSSIPSCSATSSAYMVNVNALSHNNLYETSCEYYTWNDTTYSESGEYTQTYTNAAGCDSIVTLHLTVNTPTEGDTTAIVCGSFSWYEYSDLTQSAPRVVTTPIRSPTQQAVTVSLPFTLLSTPQQRVTLRQSCAVDSAGMSILTLLKVVTTPIRSPTLQVAIASLPSTLPSTLQQKVTLRQSCAVVSAGMSILTLLKVVTTPIRSPTQQAVSAGMSILTLLKVVTTPIRSPTLQVAIASLPSILPSTLQQRVTLPPLFLAASAGTSIPT